MDDDSHYYIVRKGKIEFSKRNTLDEAKALCSSCNRKIWLPLDNYATVCKNNQTVWPEAQLKGAVPSKEADLDNILRFLMEKMTKNLIQEDIYNGRYDVGSDKFYNYIMDRCTNVIYRNNRSDGKWEIYS